MQINETENWEDLDNHEQIFILRPLSATSPPKPNNTISQNYNLMLSKTIANFMKKQKEMGDSMYYFNDVFVLAKYCKMIVGLNYENIIRNKLSDDLEAMKKVKNKNELFDILLIKNLDLHFHMTNELQNFFIEMGATIRKKNFVFDKKGTQEGGFVHMISYKPKKQQKQIKKEQSRSIHSHSNQLKGIGNFSVAKK